MPTTAPTYWQQRSALYQATRADVAEQQCEAYRALLVEALDTFRAERLAGISDRGLDLLDTFRAERLTGISDRGLDLCVRIRAALGDGDDAR